MGAFMTVVDGQQRLRTGVVVGTSEHGAALSVYELEAGDIVSRMT
jgi:hypothetical protein